MKLEHEEAPRHFEGLRFRFWVEAAGWPSSVASALGGVILAASASGTAVELLGVALTALGAVLIAGLVRCRRFETVVGRRLLNVGVGPLRRRVPIGLIDAIEVRRAGSWRLLFARSEVVLTLFAGRGAVTLPSADPEGLVTALRDVRQ